MLQDVCGSAVHFGVILPALFVMKWPSVPDRGQDQTVTDAAGGLAITREPGDRSNRAGNKQKAIGMTKLPSRKETCQKSGHG